MLIIVNVWNVWVCFSKNRHSGIITISYYIQFTSLMAIFKGLKFAISHLSRREKIDVGTDKANSNWPCLAKSLGFSMENHQWLVIFLWVTLWRFNTSVALEFNARCRVNKNPNFEMKNTEVLLEFNALFRIQKAYEIWVCLKMGAQNHQLYWEKDDQDSRLHQNSTM